MAVQKLVGPPRKLAKFISLVLALLMTGATVANIVYAQYALAVATAIIGAWALLVFAELFMGELVETMHGAENHGAIEAESHTPDAPSARGEPREG